ncbi:hypothetical protein ACFVU3_06055 [Streptomyces sp. NPDC058052]|uniref:WXG100-like domain-containing protein n=1 Tax=Streptomyces sp. NPDC058052 TaxID=3346316 RepID=UPI0036F0E108
MAINPPEGIADFLAFVSGMEWPEADEDLMRRVAEHYNTIADDLETLSGYVIELIPIVKNDFEGEAAESFLVSMRDLTGQTAGANQLEQTAELSRRLSEVALKVANQVEYSKIMAILQLVQLLAEILFATLFSAFTFGAVWGPVSALFAATREGLHQLFRWLLQTILSQTFIGIMGGVFQDTVIQLYQLTSGHTSSWNTESLLDSVKQGALSGVVAGPLEILSHYGGKILGRLLGGKPPASIISKRVDDVLNKIDDKLDDVTPNPKPDVPPGGAGKPGGPEGPKAKEDLPPSPPNTPPADVTPPPVPPKRTETAPPPVPPKSDVAPPVPPKSDVAPPVPPKTVGDGLVPPPATGRPKPETPAGAGAKDGPSAPAAGKPGAPAAGKGTAPVTGKGDVPATPPKADVPTTGKGEVPTAGKGEVPGAGKGDVPTTGKGEVPTTGKGEVPGAEKPEVPNAPRTEGGDTAGAGAGAGRTGSGDVPAAGAGSRTADAPGPVGRAAGDVENPLDDLLSTPEARSAFAKDIGELFGGVTRNLETGFMRHGAGSIADSFADKMGEVFKKHLAHEGAEQAGQDFGKMLTQKWGRAGADHADLPELLTEAMGDLGNLAPLKNLADSMPTLFARSEHSNVLARVFKQENPLQGSPMYQLGGAVASLLNEGTNEMLSEGFYNLIFGDGTFKVSGGPFASGVAMGALSAGLHRAFEPVMVKYQNWVLSHQHADNPTDSKYFGLLHPINIASFVSNMTGNPAPWPVPRPTAGAEETSFRQDMKDMVKWVFSHPITGTPFFADLPQRPDATADDDGDGDAFTPLDLDLGPSFGDEIAKDPLFRTESDGDLVADGGPDAVLTTEEDAGGTGVTAPPRATVSSDLSSLLGDDTEIPAPSPAGRPVTLSGGDAFGASVPQDTDAPARARTTAEAPSPYDWEHLETPGDDELLYLPVDDAPRTDGEDTRADDDSARTPSGDRADGKAGDGGTGDGDDGNGNAVEGGDTVGNDAGDTHGDDGGRDDDPPSGPPVRDIPSGIALGVLSPAQTTALQSIPKRPGVFVVGMHTDPDAPNDQATVLKALADAHDEGRLDGVTEIHFTACSLAAPVHEGTVRTVMSGLWKHRAQSGAAPTPDPLTARAADAPVWYVPTTGGDPDRTHHLLTAQHIGLTPDGKIAVVDRGAWHVYGDSGDPEHTPVRTTPDPDALPDDAVAFLFRTPAVDAEHPDAVKFGDGDGDDRPPAQDDPLASAQDASLDDMDRIAYTEASVQYERNLAAYLARRRDVQELAGQLSGVLWDKLHRMEGIHERLGTQSNESPGAVGTGWAQLEQVARNGNLRERMALYFNAISSKALGERIGHAPAPPSSILDERKYRYDNHEFVAYRKLTDQVPALREKVSAMPEGTDEEKERKKEARRDFEKRDRRWKQLSAELRSFGEADIVPRLSARERPLALNAERKVRWIPGGARYLLKTELLYLKQTQERLVTAGTSGSGFMFHRYAQLMVERGWFPRISHRTLRLAIVASFINQGHHSLPEVMAGSAAFAAYYREKHPGRPLPDDIAALEAPPSEPGRDYYRTMNLVPEAELRAYVAHEGRFPDEIAERTMEELRRTYAARDEESGPAGSASADMDLDESVSQPSSSGSSGRKRGNPDDRDEDGDVLMQDPKRPRQGDDDGDTAANVPENSPHTLPGRVRPEEVSPAARPVTADRWASWRWAPGREDVPPPARVRTERFDPAADPDATGPFPGTADRRNEDGTLAGRRTLIRADVERFVVPEDGDGAPGGPVRLVRVTLPVAVGDSFSAADAASLRDRMQGLLDSHVNLGFRLPRTGDQLHMEVDLVPAPGGADLVRVTRDGGPGTRSDQLNLRLHADGSDPDARGRDDAMLLHELLHYAGLPDRYHDAETLFRHTPDRADASGVMATSVLPDGTLPRRYLEAVEDATESGSVLHDNEGPGSWTVPSPSPVRDIPAGIAVGALSPAQAAALRALPARPGVFVVGTHTDPDAPHDPAVLLKALTDAHDEGRLDGVTEIRFTGCGLASPVHGSTVRTVMSGLWKHRAENGEDSPLTALAADAPVWYVPGGDRVFTARHVGVTADGRMTVLGGADWHRYTDTGAPDHTAETTPAGDDGAPADAERLTDGDETGPEYEGAVRFGGDTDDEDGGEAGVGNGDTDGDDEAVAVSMLVDGLPDLKRRTVSFGKGEKTLGPQDETELRNLAAELFPELVRRAGDPSLGELRIEIVAAGNNLRPGAAEKTGWQRAQAVSLLLKEEIHRLAQGLRQEKAISRAQAETAPGLASFTLLSRGLTGIRGLDTSGDVSRTARRRRATATAEVTYESAYRPRLTLSVETTAQAVDLFRRMADRPVAERTAVSLDELTGPRIFWKSSSDLPDNHNLVIQVQTAQGGGQRHLTGNMSLFTPGTLVHVASFERTDSGRSLVTLLEVGPDTVWPPEGPERGEPVLGLPGVGYPGPNRPFDSTLKYVKEDLRPKDGEGKGEGKGRKKGREKDPRTTAEEKRKPGTEAESSASASARPNPDANPDANPDDAPQTSGHYEFQQAYYIHRGEVDVEMEDGEPYVRFYTAVVSRDTVTAHEKPHEFTAEHKDVQQHKDTGEVVVATGDKPGGTLWVGMGTPARAIGWAMKYQAQFPDKQPLIRSFLVPLHVYQRITSASVPEHDAGSLGHPYRGSASLTPEGLRDPEENPESEVEKIYQARWNRRAPGSAPVPIPEHTETDRSHGADEDPEPTVDRPLAGRPVNTDQSGERNQFGVRGENLLLLRRSIRPHSLITYYGNREKPGLTPDGDTGHYRDGDAVHVDVLRDRLGIPSVDAPQLKDRYNPWVQNAGHVNSPDVLRGISGQLRQFHETWKQSRQRPAERRVGYLLEPDMPPEPYGNRPNLAFGKRLADLKKFLDEHKQYLTDPQNKPVPLDFLGTPDPDLKSPADLDARAAVETFMKNTVLPWASHAEIGLVLSLQSQEVKNDLNITDSPFVHDFDDMRRRQPEEAHLQRQVGEELTGLWREGTSPHRVIDRLIRDYPELALLYKEICATSEGYTFFQHAQMVLGQYLKLAHRDRDSAERLVPVDAVVKAILFHDIEKANSKLMYGGDGKSKARKAELHDHEAEHRGAVEVMNRYRYLWGDVDKDPSARFAYRAAVMMVDSDPFGFYYRDKHHFLRPKGSDDDARAESGRLNRDVTFHWIVESAMRLRGRDLVTSDGDVRRLAELTTEDTEDIRRLFHEFHQYYQADFSSYTTYSTYVGYKEPRTTPEERARAEENARTTRRRAEENAEREKQGLDPLPQLPPAPSFRIASRELDAVKSGQKTFTELFAPVPEKKKLVLNPDNPYGTGPRTAETSPVRGRSSLRFVFADLERHYGIATMFDDPEGLSPHKDYEGMYHELAKMFESEESFREHYQRVGGERMRQEAKYLGDEKNAKGDDSEAPAQKKVKKVTNLLDEEGADDLFIEFGNDRTSAPTATPSSATPSSASADALDDAPATVRASDERIGELVEALTRSHQDNGTRHLVDPDAGDAEADRIRGAVGRFPRDDRFFTLASHITGNDGAPVWRGQRVTPGELAAVLSRLADQGAWDTAKPLRFAACGLGGDVERSYAADTLRELRRLRPELPLTAYAPRSTLWFVPSVTGTDPSGTGHTVVARKVAWGADGTPRLVPDHWVRLSLPADGDGAVEATLLGAHMPPDGVLPDDALSPDDVPVTTPAPEGYLVDDGPADGDSSRAVPFGPASDAGDGRPESSAAALRREEARRRAATDHGTDARRRDEARRRALAERVVAALLATPRPAADGSRADDTSRVSPGSPHDAVTATTSSSEDSPSPRAPWYTARQALGDGQVMTVTGAAPRRKDLERALAPLAERLGGRETVDRIARKLAPLLGGNTPADWDGFLRKGAAFPLGDRTVIVTAGPSGLTHSSVQPEGQPAPYASRNQPVAGHVQSSGGNLGFSGGLDAVTKLAGLGAPTGVTPTVKVQAGGSYGSARTATAETQAAGRTVLKAMNEFTGGVALRVHVIGRNGDASTAEASLPVQLRFAFPADVTPDAPEDDWHVVRPEALKTVLSTVNAIAPGPLLVDLAATLHKAGFAPDAVSRFVSDVADDFFNEKSLKDGNQWWSTGSLTSRAFSGGGLRKSLGGHFVVGAALTGLRPKGTTGSALRVREDFSATFGVKSSNKHADRSGIAFGATVPLSTSAFSFAPNGELGFSASRTHNFDVGGSDKGKVKIKHKEEIQAEYHATARFHVEFLSTSRRPPLTFTSTVELAVGVPASRSADFEDLLLGPEAERTPAKEQPVRDTSEVAHHPSRLQTAGAAVLAALRPARKEPSALLDRTTAPPFPKRPVTGPAGLLKASERHPIEIAAPGGRLPAGAAWAGLDGNPRVTPVALDQLYTPVPPGASAPALRYQVDALGRITGVQRLRPSTFAEAFGTLETADHAARLAELHAGHPQLAFDVRSTPDGPSVLVPPGLAGVPRLPVRPGPDGTLTVLGTVHHPIEHAPGPDRTTAETTAPEPRDVQDVVVDLRRLGSLDQPVAVRVDPGYPHADALAHSLRDDPGLTVLQDGGTPRAVEDRRPSGYAVEVAADGTVTGPVRRRDFAKDPREPAALASRTGLGSGVASELPGGEQVLKAARNWLDSHLERNGLKNGLDEERYAQFHRELEASFGTPALRAHFADLLGSGVPLVLHVGGREIRLHLRSELLDLWGRSTEDGLSTTRAVTHSTNQAVGVGDQSGGSLSLGFTPRFEPQKDHRIEMPSARIGGGVTFSNTKESVAATVKTSREQETSGGHTVFSYEVVHHLTATVHASGGELVSGTALTVEGPGVSAKVRVGDDHLAAPGAPVSPAVGTVRDHVADDTAWENHTERRVMPALRQGTGTIHPEFLGTSHLALVTARTVAGDSGENPPQGLDDAFARHSEDAVGALRRGLTQEIEKVFTPTFLQSRFEQLIGADGAVFPLPRTSSGRSQALVIRLRAGRLQHEGTGAGTSLGYVAETGTKSSTATTRSYNFGFGAGAGGFAGLTDRGVSVAGSATLDYTRTHTAVRTDASANTLSSTLTHKGTTHRYRADAHYEITHHTWKPADRLTTGPSDHTTTTRYVQVNGGLELSVPEPEARALALDVPAGPSPAAGSASGSGTTAGNRVYLDADLAKAVAHVEKLDAEHVLPTVRRLLGALPDMPADVDGSIPTDLSRGLSAVFSAESLRADFTALTTTSVRQLVTLRQRTGGTRLIGIRVKAELGAPAHTGSRDTATLVTGDTATASGASATGTSNRLSLQGTLAVKGLDAAGKPVAGVRAGGGLEGTTGSTRTETSSERDQHTLEFTGAVQQFTHPVRYQVDIFEASEPHQLAQMAETALKAPARLVDRATDGRAERWLADRWGEQWDRFFPSGHTPKQNETIPGKTVRLLVPDHLTGETAPAPPARAEPKVSVRPQGPSVVPPRVERLGTALASEIQALSLPKLDAVVKWLPTAAARPHRVEAGDTDALTRGDLAPTTLAGLRTDLLTTERNLRAHVRQLLGGGYEVPVAGTGKVTVRLLVHRTTHIASETLDTNVETGAREREAEREREKGTTAWSASAAPDVRLHSTSLGEPGEPGASELAVNLNAQLLGIGGESGNNLGTSRSETVDERDRKKGLQHYYRADVTWVLTGSRNTTVEIEVPGGLIGLLSDTAVDTLLKNHQDDFGAKPTPKTKETTETTETTTKETTTKETKEAEETTETTRTTGTPGPPKRSRPTVSFSLPTVDWTS